MVHKETKRKTMCHIYTNVRWPQQDNWWEKSFTINFRHLIKMIDSSYLHWCQCPTWVSAFIFLTLTPNIPILFTAIPQCIIIRSTHYIGHRRVFNPFTITYSDMCFHAVMIHLQRGVTLDYILSKQPLNILVLGDFWAVCSPQHVIPASRKLPQPPPCHVWQWCHCTWNWLWLLFQMLKCQLYISNTINPHFLKSTLYCPMQPINHELWLSGFPTSVCLLVFHSYPSWFAKQTDAVIIMNFDSPTF